MILEFSQGVGSALFSVFWGPPYGEAQSANKIFEFKEALHRRKTGFLTIFTKFRLEKKFFIYNFYHLIRKFPGINKSKTFKTPDNIYMYLYVITLCNSQLLQKRKVQKRFVELYTYEFVLDNFFYSLRLIWEPPKLGNRSLNYPVLDPDFI